MQTRAFGSRQVSEVGLGCWQLGGACWGSVDGNSILNTSLESGVSFLDTADCYGSGTSETLLGNTLGGLAEDKKQALFVATKIPRIGDEGEDFDWKEAITEATFRRRVADCCTRLRVSSLDLVQLHCIPTEYLREGSCFTWLRTLQTEGKIARWGASVESMEEAKICLQQDGLSSLQIIFNIFRQKPIQIFAECRQKGVALIARVPLASGVLAGKFTAQTAFDSKDHRSFNADGKAFNVGETFAGVPFTTGVSIVEDRIRPLYERYCKQCTGGQERETKEGEDPIGEGGETTGTLTATPSMAQFALRWILDHADITVVIPGASRPSQAQANAQVSSMPPLSEAMHKELAEIYAKHIHDEIRGVY